MLFVENIFYGPTKVIQSTRKVIYLLETYSYLSNGTFEFEVPSYKQPHLEYPINGFEKTG